MPLPPGVQQAARNYFSKLTSVNRYSNISSDGNKYELYVYCLTHQALSSNFRLSPQSLDGGNRFIFKCSPGPINISYSYFEFVDSKGNTCELRNGIEVQGYALDHEIDVCVFIKDPGLGYNSRPNHTCLRLSLECKMYNKASGLKGEARKFLGAMSDFSSKAKMPHKGTKNVGSVHLGFSFFRSFVTNVSSNLRQDIQDFLAAYVLYPQFGVVPITVEELDFITRIEAHSATW